MSKRTEINFPCPYSVDERYQLICTGEYGVFEMYNNDGIIDGYRGYRHGYGSTGIYSTYQEALEASFIEFGPRALENNKIRRCIP